MVEVIVYTLTAMSGIAINWGILELIIRLKNLKASHRNSFLTALILGITTSIIGIMLIPFEAGAIFAGVINLMLLFTFGTFLVSKLFNLGWRKALNVVLYWFVGLIIVYFILGIFLAILGF